MAERVLKPGWMWVKFGDMVRQVKDKVDAKPSGLKWYVAGDHMDTDDLRIWRRGEITDDYLGPAFHMRFRPGQVLYGSRRTYLRKVAVADFEGICANTTFVLESTNPDVLLPDLLPFVMQTEAFHGFSIKSSRGSVNPYINFSDLAEYEFALPPLAEQRRITELLEASELLMQELLQMIEVSFKLREAVQEDLLVRDAQSDTPKVRIDTLVEVNPRDPPIPGDAPFVPMDAIPEWSRNIERFEARGSRGGVRARAGDILMARITPCLENGKTAQVPDSIERCGGSTELIVLRPRRYVSSDYVYWVTTAPSVRHRAIGLMHGSTGRQRLAAQDFASIRIPLVPETKRKETIQLLNSLEAERERLVARTQSCKRLKMQISFELLNGE